MFKKKKIIAVDKSFREDYGVMVEIEIDIENGIFKILKSHILSDNCIEHKFSINDGINEFCVFCGEIKLPLDK